MNPSPLRPAPARLADALRARLKEAGDPVRARAERRYMKSARVHWGAGTPAIDAAIADLAAEFGDADLRATAKLLWAVDVWDAMIAAGRLLSLRRVPPSPKLWRQIVSMMRQADAWALADQLAIPARKCLSADPKLLDALEKWLTHRNLWHRRACLVFTLPWAKRGADPARSLEWAARLVADQEWFVQKAIGWWLRELGKHDPTRVRAFLAAHGATLKPFARREATKRLGSRIVR